MSVRRIDLSYVHVDPVDLIGLSRLSDLPDASLTLSGTWETPQPTRTPFTARWIANPPYTQADADAMVGKPCTVEIDGGLTFTGTIDSAQVEPGGAALFLRGEFAW